MMLKIPLSLLMVRIFSVLFLIVLGVTVACYIYISFTSRTYLYSDPDELPVNKTGLLLGTSRYLSSGAANPYFDSRIQAAVRLYRLGKIRYIIASGDNGNTSYNEPRRMQEELLKQGIPEKAIYLDYAGFRTLDSVVRGNRIFGQKRFTIISQKFHNERALYISRNFGIDAVAFNAGDVRGVMSWKTNLREFLARVKAVIDVRILNKQPKFLGDSIRIGH